MEHLGSVPRTVLWGSCTGRNLPIPKGRAKFVSGAKMRIVKKRVQNREMNRNSRDSVLHRAPAIAGKLVYSRNEGSLRKFGFFSQPL